MVVLAAALMFVGFEEEIVEQKRITIKINLAKYCIALIHSEILNYQPNSV